MTKIGPPFKYKNTYPDELVALMAKGLLDVQVYANWDVSKDTFYRWLNEYPELREAHNVGLAKCEAVYIYKAQDCLDKGDDKGFKYFISLMNNKFHWEKGSKTDTTTNITIGNMNVLQHMTREKLIQDITGQLEKHQDLIECDIKSDTIEHVIEEDINGPE